MINCYSPMSKLSLYDDAFLTQMRQQMDPLADQAVAAMYQHPAGGTFRETIATLITNDYTIPDDLPGEVTHFLEKSRTLPDWADEQLLRRGHDFYAQHTPELLMMLGLLSLPYDYAAADGAQVLYLSERLRNDPGKRLAETGQYVLDVGSKDAFGPRGKAICSAQKVRLIHAAIRYHLLKDERWNFDWGQPVNQEDMAGTNLSMSLLPVRGMRQLGIRVAAEDQNAYVHLWNVASYLMGVDERLLPDTGKEAFWLTKLISERHHRPSEAGCVLTKSLLDYMQQNAPSNLSALAPGLHAPAAGRCGGGYSGPSEGCAATEAAGFALAGAERFAEPDRISDRNVPGHAAASAAGDQAAAGRHLPNARATGRFLAN